VKGSFGAKYKGVHGLVAFEQFSTGLMFGDNVAGGFRVKLRGNPVGVQQVTVYQCTHHLMLSLSGKFNSTTKFPKTLGGIRSKLDELRLICDHIKHVGLTGQSAGHRIEVRAVIQIPQNIASAAAVRDLLMNAVGGIGDDSLLHSVPSVAHWLSQFNVAHGFNNFQFAVRSVTVKVKSLVKAFDSFMNLFLEKFDFATTICRKKAGKGINEDALLILLCCAELVGFSPYIWSSGIRHRLWNNDLDECRVAWNRVYDAVVPQQRIINVGAGAGGDSDDYGAGNDHDDEERGLDNILGGLNLGGFDSDEDRDGPGGPILAPIVYPDQDYNDILDANADLVDVLVDLDERFLDLQKVKGKDKYLWCARMKQNRGGTLTKDCYSEEEVVAHILLKCPELIAIPPIPPEDRIIRRKPQKKIDDQIPFFYPVAVDDARTLVANEAIWIKSRLTHDKQDKLSHPKSRKAICWKLRLANGKLTRDNVLTKFEVALRLADEAYLPGNLAADLLWNQDIDFAESGSSGDESKGLSDLDSDED
jgi:hypothetical protein